MGTLTSRTPFPTTSTGQESSDHQEESLQEQDERLGLVDALVWIGMLTIGAACWAGGVLLLVHLL